MPLAGTRHTHLLMGLYPVMETKLCDTQRARKVNCGLCNICLIVKWALQEALELDQKFQKCGPRTPYLRLTL